MPRTPSHSDPFGRRPHIGNGQVRTSDDPFCPGQDSHNTHLAPRLLVGNLMATKRPPPSVVRIGPLETASPPDRRLSIDATWHASPSRRLRSSGPPRSRSGLSDLRDFAKMPCEHHSEAVFTRASGPHTR
jgi:hypothetical protein